ncbi:response regulator [Aliishimia ponticola]|nr:response regulator [Aliishimia ponticola]
MIIDDNDDDFEATERALRKSSNLANPLIRCSDGAEAWDMLNNQDNLLPALILLDLNMPGLDGRRLLARIKQDERLCVIPVVIMTTSTREEDVSQCYAMGANTYVRKPVSWNEFSEAISRLHDYWFHFALLPKQV